MTLHASAQVQRDPPLEAVSLDKYMQQFAKLDQETGLLNYDAFCAAINVELARGGSSPNSTLIEIKIKGLTRIAESFGRKAASFAVRALADRINLLGLKEAILGRIDHKSYGVFLCQVSDPVAALHIVKDILKRLAESIVWDDHMLACEAVAGIAITAREDADALTLMHHAGLALRASPGHGGPGYAFFNPQDALAAKRRNELLGVVARAVEDRAFHLVYQPFFSFSTGKLAGFEALMRLRHPVFGNISPIEFIPIAEELGLIKKLGAWVFEEACSTASEWPPHLTISVNCSPAQFYTGMLISDVNHALTKSQFAAYRLEVEITEGTILKDEEMVLSQLNALSELGCAIALDDFGTGYSSLSYLWKFPFSKLKIDRSFIQVLDTTPKAPGILRSIMDLSRNLGLEVTAEGIETMEQMQTLRELDCDYLQGYLCGRPTEKTELAAAILKNFSDILARKGASPFEMAQPHTRRIRVIR